MTNTLSTADAKAIEIAKSKSVKEVSLCGRNITAIGVKALASMPTLTKLDLDCNPIGDEGAIEIAKSESVKEASLVRCNITAIGVKALASNRHLEYLGLYGNPIGDEGAIELAKSKSLKHAGLYDCGITDTGALALADSDIEVLFLCGNPISEPVKEELMARKDKRIFC